ncbi:uncharacterized protein [Mytilus edulis]|uniref:uncharacterized protein isoform X1 n=2 Tax=Mytilus edulis TaxID=6550 RepID=UPI0039F132D8
MIRNDTFESPSNSSQVILVREATINTMATQEEVELPNMVGEMKLDSGVTNDSPVLEINCNTSNPDQTEDQQTTDTQQTLNDQKKNGINNPVFSEEGTIEETIPPITYVDFLPQKTHAEIATDPTFSDFSSIIEQANSWLTLNPEYSLWKCETVTFKIKNDFTSDQDDPVYMESAFGLNRYLSGLRLWLVPQMNSTLPVAQIGFTTALPGKLDEYNYVIASSHSTIQDSIEQLNKQFIKKPLPGVILNVEMIEFHENESSGSMSIDPNKTYWEEKGTENMVKISAVRVYFIIGKPEYVKIGYHDEQPSMQHVPFSTVVKFGPFRDVVTKMGYWLKSQKGIRVVNLQSINVVVSYSRDVKAHLDPTQNCSTEKTGIESRYAKVLRAFYVQQKSDEVPYSSLNLHTRLFVPVLREGKLFESVSKTMQRTIKWLDYTRVPPFSVETIQYQVYLGGESVGNLEDKVDKSVRRTNGRYQLSTFRIYFPSEFSEPPPEIAPEVDTAAGWGCVIS